MILYSFITVILATTASVSATAAVADTTKNEPTLRKTSGAALTRGLNDETTYCGCTSCVNSVWNTNAGGHTCGGRISWLQNALAYSQAHACHQVAGVEFPTECAGCDSQTCNEEDDILLELFCGCPECTQEAMDATAGGPSCGSRMDWLQNTMGVSEHDACLKVASVEFPSECEPCDPSRCHLVPTLAPTSSPTAGNLVPRRKECGGAVNSALDQDPTVTSCLNDLWEPTDSTFSDMHCFAYGGSSDPCHLSNTNDVNDGLDKDPSLCTAAQGDTFFLWDEPDTQGRSYVWAGLEWRDYAQRFASEVAVMREAGILVTTPLIRAGSAGVIAQNVQAFFQACGSDCLDPDSPAYVDIIAVNAFCGSWNQAPLFCRGGANFITSELQALVSSSSDYQDLSVYLTNWGHLGSTEASAQVDAIDAVDAFFVPDSPVNRVYWFGATDYGGGTDNNFLTDTAADSGETLGTLWKEKCDSL